MIPAVLLITDGNPTDDFDAGLAALMGTRAGRSAIRLALAVGNEVDEDCLTRFIANPGDPGPPRRQPGGSPTGSGRSRSR